MKKRVVTSIIGLSLFALILWLGKEYYSLFLFFIALATFIEFCKMRDILWYRLEGLIGLMTVMLIFGSGLLERNLYFPLQIRSPYDLLIPFILLCLWILLSRNTFHLDQMNYLFVGAIYIGYGFTFMMETMWLENGLPLTLFIFFVTWGNDSSAYFVGKKWGKRRLWPSISPKKTIEGSLAGIVAGLTVGVILFLLFPELGDITKVVVLGFVVTITGQIGDLVESAWKRTIGVKDSGNILPGHGGFFDRFDSLLFIFIVLYTFGVLG